MCPILFSIMLAMEDQSEMKSAFRELQFPGEAWADESIEGNF